MSNYIGEFILAESLRKEDWKDIEFGNDILNFFDNHKQFSVYISSINNNEGKDYVNTGFSFSCSVIFMDREHKAAVSLPIYHVEGNFVYLNFRLCRDGDNIIKLAQIRMF